ncbi:ABC transporter substrate-binding protein [Methylotuvimicrobium alcaliphilum]|uniref:Substrate-binding protein involved in ABC-type nitrate/sulfonate/bicarbonate transport system n=1 Tax=Methylotuvimicrobium alcaliphilum (strain DSM 19304 / NCIMB 14124 / VKM B-2133 / 20Z) TaxID=1091494 RepID=G4SU03_META2|nr:ABC transporter substrate-binding protein [Methylotuvimicrobium alcaliphilum]CCE22826.1 Substrate-binding protein involved in ABC-type nitrate/sulfonate/bicarbonate transport system [Methylotuvimicrobium alcaliphilum 20Z]
MTTTDLTKHLSRRHFIRCLTALSLSPWLPGCESLFARRIAIAAHAWPGYEFLFLAQREKWLDSSLVDLMETTSATESLSALIEGKIDGAALTLDEVLTTRASGLPLTVVLVFNISAGADMLLARPYIVKSADLKGQRIGFEKGTVGSLLLHKALDAAGLSMAEITAVPLTIDAHFQAWQQQKVDALVTYDPIASRLLREGATKLFDSRKIPDTILDVLAFRTDRLDFSRAPAIRHLVSAHLKALEHLTKNPQDAAYRMAPRFKLSPAQVLGTYKGLVIPDRSNNRRLLEGSSPILLDSARNLSIFMYESGKLPHENDLTDLIDPSYL